jgi:fructosamine-3-kinase
MRDTELRRELERLLADSAGTRAPGSWQPLGEGVGGIRWRLRLGEADFFVKLDASDSGLLAAEADGLAALQQAGSVRVPRALHCGVFRGAAYLTMEWLPLAHRHPQSAARLGEVLARQHLQYAARCGWPRHNFIGATPQFNMPSDDWPGFFAEHRLRFQLRLAAENGCRGALQESGAQLLEVLPKFFEGYAPRPSLLHGDLWGGNWGALPSGEPVVFDPAVYWGDREADLAMTELFGGFGAEFYAAYRQHAPLDPGYPVRRELYNLYHVLNHLNLFGGSYLDQALDMMRRLLAEAE